MRRTDNIGQCEERMVIRRWFRIEDIQASTCQVTRTQSVEQGDLVDQRAPRYIDKVAAPGSSFSVSALMIR